MSLNNSSQGSGGRDYTDRDINLVAIIRFAVGIAIFTAAVFAGSAYLIKAMNQASAKADERAMPLATQRMLPSNAVLQVHEVMDLAAHRAWEANLLTNYAVLDATTGVYRIPVERAMDRLIETKALTSRKAGRP